ncbi:MAG TPA: 16S rRNA (adenine(1518)-N(6)/adenine(1519)-N(6))-dimethyltransferase RsmA [Candidatus Paceibacterota bacterium]|nr:16S rRNA (adenine(1518)-N(6)/adenine(1519)-N(6))-dimethyltransferase RsmA [Candidatus Paceibacterota bacterium]
MPRFAKRPHSGRKDTRAGVLRKDARIKDVSEKSLERYVAKKSLGQHFLTSQAAIDKIIAAGEITSNDIVVEVGPGKGVLTEPLLIFAGKVVAIEKDEELAAELKERYSRAIEGFRLDLIVGDVLDFDPVVALKSSKRELHYKVIANIPYYITNAIIRMFLETAAQPDLMVLLIQKEVAERILARDGKESILSIAVKAYGTPKVAAKVLAGSFNPPPKVDSAILVINDISKKLFENIDEKVFFKAVRAGFAHKRKKLASNLTAVYKKDKIKEVFEKLKMPADTRAEDITVKDWKKIVQEFSK